MTQVLVLHLGRTENDDKREVTGEFEDEEWEQLLRYDNYADQLSNIKLVRNGGPGKLIVHYDKNKGLSCSVDVPPEEQVVALLHRLRPFILNNEPTNFSKICNIIGRRFNDDNLRRFLKSLRGYYQGQNMQNMMLLTSNNVLINSEETLQKWLNAYEYHKDYDKQKELEMLHKILPLETSRAIFIMNIYDKVRAIMIISHLIKVLAGKQKCFSCKL